MKSKLLPLLIGASLSASAAFAQEAHDVILKTNGEEMVGKVTEVSDDALKFQYKGETVTYTVKRNDVFRVTFASGRVQIFTQPTAAKPAEGKTSGETHTVVRNNVDHKNRVAVLPIRFNSDRQGDHPEEMAYSAQEEAYNILNRSLAGKTLLDLPTTNALLLKSNVTLNNLRSYTPKELCDILGVETLVQANVNVRLQNETRSTNQNTNLNVNESSGKTGNNGSIKGNSNSTTTTQRSYQSKVAVMVYNDAGQTLFSDDRTAFFNMADSYKDALRYLLRRTPIYQR